jgi:hypothetical protein
MADLPQVPDFEDPRGTLPLAELVAAGRPAILRGFVRDWPLVQAGLESPAAAMAYLKRFEGERPVTAYTGAPEIGGRFFYNDELTALNFDAARVPLGAFLDRIAAHLDDPAPPSFYIGSTDLDLYLPGLRTENDLGLDAKLARPAIASIWIGNRTIASAHHDMSNNIACCIAGARRFTLFPPDQVANLYPGPLEPTPGGQVVCMVDFRDPDLTRYPRFAQALEQAQVADLQPGDLLFYPALWWHHVEALAPFNILINYWWNDVPAFMDTPHNTLLHAMLSLRDRPEAEKAAWKAMFDYYIFGPGTRAVAHLPEHAQGALGPLDDVKARRLRALLLNKLNR